MLFLFVFSFLYSLFIIFTFNLLPYKWLCDYNAETLSLPNPKKISMRIYFFPVYLFTFICTYIFLDCSYSILEISTSIILILLLVHIGLSDIFYMIIPDQHIILIFILGLLNVSTYSIYSQLAGLFVGALPFFLLLCLGLLIQKKEYIGFGDIKLMASLGFLVGYIDIINIYFLSCLLSGIFFIFLSLLNRIIGKNSTLKSAPFAPFIILSVIFCIPT